MLTVEEKDELLGSVREIKKRQVELYTSFAAMSKAFPKNDLGDPDFDGHRREHLGRREYDKVLNEYKVDVTKKVIWAALGLLGVLLTSGFTEHLKRMVGG